MKKIVLLCLSLLFFISVSAQTINSQPSSSTICAGTNTSFTVTAQDVSSYQWFVSTNGGSSFSLLANSGVYSGANMSTLSITGATKGMSNYKFRCLLDGGEGPMISNTVTLTVNSAPAITQHPFSAAACEGNATFFFITASDATGYQWQVNEGSGYFSITDGAGPGGSSYSGTTNAVLLINNPATAMSGFSYRCIVSGLCTPNATSTGATLTVYANVTYYEDWDEDGYGNAGVTTTSCSGAPGGFVANSLDCDDNDANVHPGAVEICYDGKDNNCDGRIDEGCVPLTQIASENCGTTIEFLNTEFISAVPVADAEQYEFRITNGAYVATAFDDAQAGKIKLTQFAGYQYGTTYQISVRAKVNGNWGIFYTECPITTTAYPYTMVEATQCGTTLPLINTPIYATQIHDATKYRFRIVNGASVQTFDAPTRAFNLTQLLNYEYNTTYTIDVAVEHEGSWYPYGPACNITTPAFPSTAIVGSQSNTTLGSISTTINATALDGATGYRFRVLNGADVQTIDKASPSFKLTELESYAFNTTYSVDVAVFYNSTYQPYGAASNITTPDRPTTSIETAQCGATLATINTPIYATGISGATQYRFRIVNGINMQTIDATSRAFNLTQLGSYDFNTTYTIDVAAETNGVFGAYGSACNVTTPILSSQVNAAQCSATLALISTSVNATPVPGATQYRFRIINGASVQTIDRLTPDFKLTQLGAYDFSTTYSIDVAVEFKGSLGPYGPACNITTPSQPTTQIDPAQQGTTLAALNTPIYATGMKDVTQYRFRIINGADVQTTDKPTRSFNISMLASYDYNTTYTIDVAVEINGQWGPYGAASNITTPAMSNANVVASQCGATLGSISTKVNATPITGATQYRFRVTEGASVQTIDKTTPSFRFTELASYRYNTTYTVDVSVEFNGMFQSYGTACSVTTPPIPQTQLQASQCGTTLPSMSSYLYADGVSGVTQYRFRITEGANVYTLNSPTRAASIASLTELKANTAYAVEAAVMADGIWGSYGAQCRIYTPQVPTQLKANQCGTTLSALNKLIYADAVTGATAYRFRITNGANVQIIDKNTNSFYINQLGSYAYGTVYSIDVAVQYAGIWQAYSNACTITTPAAGAVLTAIASNFCGTKVTANAQNINADKVLGATQYEFLAENAESGYSQSIVNNTFTFNFAQLSGILNGTVYTIKVRTKVNEVWSDYGTACSIETAGITPFGRFMTTTPQSRFSVTPEKADPKTAVDALKITNILTPNSDGKNDHWIVEKINEYPKNTVKIVSESGAVVFSATGYDNSWNGTFNGSPLNEGTYYYTIDFGTGLIRKGFITIVRQ